MKKIFLILLSVTILLAGCDPQTYHFHADEILEKVTKFELVECENNDPRMDSVKLVNVVLYRIKWLWV